MLSKIVEFVKRNQADLTISLAVALISFLSFAFGYIIAKNQERPDLKFQDIINESNDNEELPYRDNS